MTLVPPPEPPEPPPEPPEPPPESSLEPPLSGGRGRAGILGVANLMLFDVPEPFGPSAVVLK